jgi:hypothetical protein
MANGPLIPKKRPAKSAVDSIALLGYVVAGIIEATLLI